MKNLKQAQDNFLKDRGLDPNVYPSFSDIKRALDADIEDMGEYRAWWIMSSVVSILYAGWGLYGIFA